MRVVAVGGTGLVGRLVVRCLEEAGHDPVVAARSTGVDVATGRGLAAALAGVEAVIDTSNVTTARRRAAVAFFTAVSNHLVVAAQQAGVSHLVVLSIVGIDEIGLGYYEGKRRQERLVLDGPVPATVLRATQFHEFAGQLLARSSFGPLAFVPRFRSQPVAAREVAASLVALVNGPARGRAPELAGPRPEEVVSMARRLLRARGGHRVVVPVRVPGAAGTALAEGGALPRDPGTRGVQTYDEWLASDDAKEWLGTSASA